MNNYGNYMNGLGVNSMPTATQPYGYPMYNPYSMYPTINPTQQMQPNTIPNQPQSSATSNNMTNTNKIFVSGIDDVKNNRNLLPNSDYIFLDNDKPILYQKIVDGTGKFEVKAFSISPLKDTETSNNSNKSDLSNYVPLKDFEALQARLNGIERQIKDLTANKSKNDNYGKDNSNGYK